MGMVATMMAGGAAVIVAIIGIVEVVIVTAIVEVAIMTVIVVVTADKLKMFALIVNRTS